METSVLQINTGGEAFPCLFCCKHESTFHAGGMQAGRALLSAYVCFHARMYIELRICLFSPLHVVALLLKLDEENVSIPYVSVKNVSSLTAVCGTKVTAAGRIFSRYDVGCYCETSFQS